MRAADAELISQTLERIAETGADITPDIYEAFFRLRPEAVAMFGDEHDMGRGHMINEVFLSLIDQANGADYLDELARGFVRSHHSYGLRGMEAYGDFFAALRAAIAQTLASDWPKPEQDALARQCEAMLTRFQQAERALIDEKLIGPAS